MGNFKKLYVRPNLSNNGDVPASGSMSCSPDIWVAGDTPLLDYKTFLTNPANYGTQKDAKVVQHKDNYIYVRCRNGSTTSTTNNITLYWGNGDAIQWPSTWQKNIIGTDLGDTEKGKIINLAPDAIGVADRPFVWKGVPPYSGNTHYCLMTQINDDQNTNPFPKITGSIDLGKMVQNNLQWGWRNITTIDSKEQVVFRYDTQLTVPADIKDKTREYLLLLKPTKGLVGCQVSFSCSLPDSSGNKIEMPKTDITMDGRQITGCECTLEAGYQAMVTVYLYNPKKLPLPAEFDLSFEANYYANYEELEEKQALELFNPAYNDFVARNLGLSDFRKTGALVRLGAFTGRVHTNR